jgi:hypothetical protein
LYVGRGGRSNDAGIEQLGDVVASVGGRVVVVAVTALPDGTVTGSRDASPACRCGCASILERTLMPRRARRARILLIMMAAADKRGGLIRRIMEACLLHVPITEDSHPPDSVSSTARPETQIPGPKEKDTSSAALGLDSGARTSDQRGGHRRLDLHRAGPASDPRPDLHYRARSAHRAVQQGGRITRFEVQPRRAAWWHLLSRTPGSRLTA